MSRPLIAIAAISLLLGAGWAAFEAGAVPGDITLAVIAAAEAENDKTCDKCGETKGSEACEKAHKVAKELEAIGVGFLSPQELHAKVKTGAPPIIVDVLPASSYRKQHIKGAVNIQVTEIAELAPRVLPDKTAEIVVYCGSYDCAASVQAAKALKELGYTNVHDFKGGLKFWTRLDLPTGGTGGEAERK